MDHSFRLPQFYSSRVVDPDSDVGVEFVTIPTEILDRRRGDFPSRYIEALLKDNANRVEVVKDLTSAIARLIDLELPPDFAASRFSETGYHLERRQYAEVLAANMLEDAKLVYEESPLAVHDAVDLANQVQTVAQAYSLTLEDGPVVFIQHATNYIITFATLGAGEGVRRGVAQIVENLFRLKRTPQRRGRRGRRRAP